MCLNYCYYNAGINEFISFLNDKVTFGPPFICFILMNVLS